MSLEAIVDKVKTVARGVRDYFTVPDTLDDMRRYAIDQYLDNETKRQLFEGKSDEEVQQIYKTLDEKLKGRIDYHQKHLDRLSFKVGKLGGLATLLADAYNFYKGIPFDDFFLYKVALIGGKAIAELPAMYSYLKDTRDVYGAVEWLGTKALSGLIPVLGPAMDQNVVQRIIKRRVISEGVDDFLKQYGLYKEKEPLYQTVYNRVKEIAGPIAPQESYKPAYMLS